MASPVDIVNLGLAHLGAEAQVSSIDPPDGSYEAGLGARFWPIVRTEVLYQGGFSFSLKRAQLAAVGNPSTIWLYAYALPSDCINAMRVLNLAYVTAASLIAPIDSVFVLQQNALTIDNLFTERGSSDFEIEGKVLLTNEPNAVLKYTADVTDTGRFTPTCVKAMGMMMASYLAGPIIKGVDGMKIGEAWGRAAMAAMGQAAVSDANASSERSEHVAEAVRARL